MRPRIRPIGVQKMFGMDGAKLALKENLLRKFNLHTIIRLPGSIFAPYTSIATNILFFDNRRLKVVQKVSERRILGSIAWICLMVTSISPRPSQ